jgi:ribosomal protein S18 acetylase RimI-like enzyme
MFVRTAGERDLEAVRDLLAQTWHATYDAIYGAEKVAEITAEWHSVNALKSQLTRPNSEFLVADDGKRIGGMAFAIATIDPNIVTLHQLYVHPDFQRQGTGRSLLEEVEESFPEAKTLRVEVEEANGQAISFCRAQGFQPAGNIPVSGGGFGLPVMVLEKALG